MVRGKGLRVEARQRVVRRRTIGRSDLERKSRRARRQIEGETPVGGRDLRNSNRRASGIDGGDLGTGKATGAVDLQGPLDVRERRLRRKQEIERGIADGDGAVGM